MPALLRRVSGRMIQIRCVREAQVREAGEGPEQGRSQPTFTMASQPLRTRGAVYGARGPPDTPTDGSQLREHAEGERPRSRKPG